MNLANTLKSLNDNFVEFIIIGATAGIAHGYSRLTKDLDIFVKPNKENIEKLFKALKTAGYDLQDTTVEEALQKKLLFRQYILELDIHPHVAGVTFDTLWKNKITCKLADQNVYFSSLDDLIIMKKAANRPKDLEDLKFLEEIKKQQGLS
ncbi:nucleotidyltransferase [bacterium]|nr:nucleotidyltransferase [bacterium]